MSRRLNKTYLLHYRVIICLLILTTTTFLLSASADRGHQLLLKLKTEALVSHITSLQENIAYNPTKQVYNTRNAHHQKATDNAVKYIKRMFGRSKRLVITEQNVGGIRNVIGVLPAKQTSLSNRVFIVCAHYDTQAIKEPEWNPLSSKAPRCKQKRFRCCGDVRNCLHSQSV